MKFHSHCLPARVAVRGKPFPIPGGKREFGGKGTGFNGEGGWENFRPESGKVGGGVGARWSPAALEGVPGFRRLGVRGAAAGVARVSRPLRPGSASLQDLAERQRCGSPDLLQPLFLPPVSDHDPLDERAGASKVRHRLGAGAARRSSNGKRRRAVVPRHCAEERLPLLEDGSFRARQARGSPTSTWKCGWRRGSGWSDSTG